MDWCSLEHSGGIYTLTIHRAEAMNALSLALLAELAEVLADMAKKEDARCLILQGGARAFCAGADLKERTGMTEEQTRQTLGQIRTVIEGVAALPLPTIAAIRGVALGGGLELALACDLRIAATDAVIGLPETRLAIIPGAGGTQRLARLIGPARAKELIFTGRRLSGREAFAWQVVEHIAEAEAVYKTAYALAKEIAAGGPVAVRQAKFAIDRGCEVHLLQGLLVEQAAYEKVIGTADRREGLRAFAEKRAPEYQGC